MVMSLSTKLFDLRNDIIAIHLYPEEDKTGSQCERSDSEFGLFDADFCLLVFGRPVMVPMKHVPELLNDRCCRAPTDSDCHQADVCTLSEAVHI